MRRSRRMQQMEKNMTTLTTVEQQLIAEYGVVRGWIATHVYSSVFLALAAGWLVGHCL